MASSAHEVVGLSDTAARKVAGNSESPLVLNAPDVIDIT